MPPLASLTLVAGAFLNPITGTVSLPEPQFLDEASEVQPPASS
jgi:hypothetical protein